MRRRVRILKIFLIYLKFDIRDFKRIFSLFRWFKEQKFSPPSPDFVKRETLKRHSIKNCTWIETWTFKGETTRFLANNFPSVHTVEPSALLIENAQNKLQGYKNINFHKGTSEEVFEDICASLKGDLCFWLDGHYSSGSTYKAHLSTPIKHELEVIKKHLSSFNNVVILIDDVRCSFRENTDYPSLNYYVDWANSINFNWSIEHDIFIIKPKNLKMFVNTIQ